MRTELSGSGCGVSRNGELVENRLLEALRRAVQFLEREKIPFVVVGGLANAVWGEPRATRDVDLGTNNGRNLWAGIGG